MLFNLNRNMLFNLKRNIQILYNICTVYKLQYLYIVI